MTIETIWLNRELQALERPLELTSSADQVALTDDRGSRIERDARGDRGVLHHADGPYVLIGGLRPVARGLVGRFVHPPGANVVREQAILFLAPPGEVQEAFHRFPGSDRPTQLVGDGWTRSDGARVLPRLVRGTPPFFARSFDDDGVEIEIELAARRIGEDLSMVYVEDAPDRVRRLSVDEARALEPDDDARFAKARAGLAALPLVRVVGDGPIYAVRHDGHHEAAFLLLDTLWARVDPLLDGPRLAALPAPGTLFVTGDAGPARRAAMRALIDRYDGPSTLSPDLHVDRDGEWRLVRDA